MNSKTANLVQLVNMFAVTTRITRTKTLRMKLIDIKFVKEDFHIYILEYTSKMLYSHIVAACCSITSLHKQYDTQHSCTNLINTVCNFHVV